MNENQANAAASRPGQQPQMSPAPDASGGIERAGFGARLIAAVVDGMILYTAQLPLKLLDFAAALGPAPNLKKVYAVSIFKFIVSLALGMAYSGFLLSTKGATWGKMVMKLKVLDVNTGQYPNFVQGALREVAKLISAILLMVGYLMVAFRKDKRALHDLMLDTIVVKVKR